MPYRLGPAALGNLIAILVQGILLDTLLLRFRLTWVTPRGNTELERRVVGLRVAIRSLLLTNKESRSEQRLRFLVSRLDGGKHVSRSAVS